MLSPADIVVQHPDGRPVVDIEVQNRDRLPPDLAAGMRRNLIEHGAASDAPYFMVLSQDDGFLWQQTPDTPPHAPPDRHFPMRPVLTRYLSEEDSGLRFGSAQLALIVYRWVQDLADGDYPADSEPERTLRPSGLLDLIRGGKVLTEIWA
jgi:hypothetical protein